MATTREALGADDAETAVTTGELGLVLLAGAAVVLAAIVAARVAHGIGLPGLLLFLGLGLALGEAGAGVRFDDAGLAEALGLSALVLILAEGGLTTNWAHARAAAPEALSLATIGVAVSMLVVAMTSCRQVAGIQDSPPFRDAATSSASSDASVCGASYGIGGACTACMDSRCCGEEAPAECAGGFTVPT